MKKNLLLLLFFFLQSVQIMANPPSEQPTVSVELLTQQDAEPLVLFHLSGFPKKKKLTLSVYRPLLPKNKQVTSTSFFVDDLEKIPMTSLGFLRGERVFFLFYLDEKTFAGMSFVPHPITTENPTGEMSITAELLTLKPACYVLHLQGFKEGEDYVFRSESGKEVIENIQTFNAKRINTISPGVVKKKGGVGKLTIRVREQDLTIELPWGKSMDDYANGVKPSKAKKKKSSSDDEGKNRKVKKA